MTGIPGSAIQSLPLVQPQLTKMGNYFAMSQEDGTVTLIAYSEYQFTIEGLNNLSSISGSTTLDIRINGVSVAGLQNLSVTTVSQSPVVSATVSVGDMLEAVFTNSTADARGVKFTMKGVIR